MAKTAKRTASESKTKKKNRKNKKSGPYTVAMKLTTPKDNPFETIWSRRKFDILGKKKGKGEERRIGLARSFAIEKRKKTLLKEYEQSGKSSVFVDKRIGEKNEELGEFDKGIMRSQRQRQLRLNKKSKYNLSDGEEENFEIPNLGALSEKDDFNDEMLSDDDKDVEADEIRSNLKQLDAHDMAYLVDQGMAEGEAKKHKTKKQVMEEVILKNKYFKAQKAKEKEENEHLMEELDKSFTSLVQSQVLLSLTEPGKMNALKALVNKEISNEHVKKDDLSITQKPEADKQDQPDTYDKLVKAMSLDIRAFPSDRTKTPEEIAQEERERLEQLEEERLKRMSAHDSSDEENNDVEKPSTKLRSVSGDDLGDSFSLHEEPKAAKGWVDEIFERRDADDSENESDGFSEDTESAEVDSDNEGSDEGDSGEDNDGHNRTKSLKVWEQSDDDNLSTDLEEYDNLDDENEEVELRDRKKSKKNDNIETREGDTGSFDAKKIKQHSTEPDTPFLIEAPKSFEELSALLDNCSNANVTIVISRIRKTNSIKLAAGNRKKMQVFYGLLLQYFAVLASQKPLNFELLNLLVKPLIEMSMEIPYFSAICARQRILRMRAQFCESIKNSEASCWPSMKTLSLLRLWSMIFPCSDFRHVVMTPAILLMCEYLMRCPILSGHDIAVGSFLCSMMLSVTKQSKKFCPEAILFLQSLLMAAIERKSAPYLESQFNNLGELKRLRPLRCMHCCVNEISPLNFFMIMDMPEDSPFFSSDKFRAGVLVTVIETLRGYVEIYEGLSSFPEIFLPVSMLIIEVAKQENVPAALKDKFEAVAQLIRKKVDEHYLLRRPLQMRKQKPVPIKLLNPKFEENFVKGRDYDPDRDRAEGRKLKKLLKREAKGAARELRKDNYFLFDVKEKEKALMEEERAEKYGKARAFLQEQESAFKSGQLGKGGKRRR